MRRNRQAETKLTFYILPFNGQIAIKTVMLKAIYKTKQHY